MRKFEPLGYTTMKRLFNDIGCDTREAVRLLQAVLTDHYNGLESTDADSRTLLFVGDELEALLIKLDKRESKGKK